MWGRWIGVCARSKMHITLVFMFVWCRAVGCVSGLRDAALLALTFMFKNISLYELTN